MVEKKLNSDSLLVKATLKNLPITPRKTRLVANAVRDKSIQEALIILENLPQRAAPALQKLFRSAVANATLNSKIPFDNLRVDSLLVGEGRKLKRFRPRAKGSAYPIWKRSSHIFLQLRAVNPELSQAKKINKNTIDLTKVSLPKQASPAEKKTLAQKKSIK